MAAEFDVLAPPLAVVGGRRYRKVVGSRSSSGYGAADGEEGGEHGALLTSAAEAAADYQHIEQRADGTYCTSVTVSPRFFGIVIGRRAETKKKLERETRTSIAVPRQGSPSEEITVTGQTAQSVDSCATRIQVMVSSARERTPASHFLSIPLFSADVAAHIGAFQAQALETDGQLDATLFQRPQKLHLTLGMMKLFTREERSRAAELLSETLDAAVTAALGKRRRIALHGLAYMNDDPHAVDVLYINSRMADDTPDQHSLQAFADALSHKFIAAGLMEEERYGTGEGVKLHATLLNSLWRKQPAAPAAGGAKRTPFDASTILATFGQHDFGSTALDAVHISTRGQFGPDGFYVPLHWAPVPAP